MLQEVTTGMGPHLIYKTIGGNVDLYFFPGPLPEDVVNQYQALIGTPFLPAYWALGFQLCRYGYHNLGEMQAAVSRTQQAGIPLDVTYADIDYMDRYKDFTTGSVGYIVNVEISYAVSSIHFKKFALN
jgi:alpha-glucosidase (family GH31 glycosyl hydrolase)